jgi:tetratricopeptide (TPR) repeat protein
MMSDENKSEQASPDTTLEMMEFDQEQLTALEPKMRRALTAREQGNDGEARKLFEAILKEEPRLAEPRLELSHMAALTEDWEEAQSQARLAVEILKRGGQWTQDVEPQVLLGFALNLLGELMVRPLEEGDLFLTDRPRFDACWNEASTLFGLAMATDPSNVDARRNATRYRRLELES